MTPQDAVEALKALLWELPAEFGTDPEECVWARSEFSVLKKSNVRKVHEALWDLQQYFGMVDDDSIRGQD